MPPKKASTGAAATSASKKAAPSHSSYRGMFLSHIFPDFFSPPRRVKLMLISFGSRINADYCNIDMIKDAIVSVSKSLSRFGWVCRVVLVLRVALRPWGFKARLQPSPLPGNTCNWNRLLFDYWFIWLTLFFPDFSWKSAMVAGTLFFGFWSSYPHRVLPGASRHDDLSSVYTARGSSSLTVYLPVYLPISSVY